MTIQNTNPYAYIGEDCSNLISHVKKSCKIKSDLINLVIAVDIKKYSRNETNDCIRNIARKCNSLIPNITQACKENGQPIINFIQTVFPNYPGPNGKSLVEIAYEQNILTFDNIKDKDILKSNVACLVKSLGNSKEKLPVLIIIISTVVSVILIIFVIFGILLYIIRKQQKLQEQAKNDDQELGAQSFTSLMADLRQDINSVSSFTRCLNGTFP